MEVNRFEVYLISLDPAKGHEIKKTRPCVIISPNEMNHYISTIIVAPMASKGRNYPTRVPCAFKGIKGQVVLDQIRTVDKTRLVKKTGMLSKAVQQKILAVLQEMFAD